MKEGKAAHSGGETAPLKRPIKRSMSKHKSSGGGVLRVGSPRMHMLPL